MVSLTHMHMPHSMSQLVFTVVTATPSFDQLETGIRLQTEICQSCRQTSDAVSLGASRVVNPRCRERATRRRARIRALLDTLSPFR